MTRKDLESRIKQRVHDQFSPVAGDYVSSVTHAQGADLNRLLNLAEPEGHERVLDVATGGGHTALAFAPHVHSVVASDLTMEMLQAARQHITAQGVSNVAFCQSPAEVLPFASNHFDLVTCRVAAHHFANARAFTCEAARVLRPGGMLIISDHIGLEDAALDAFMDLFERWRDPSHVRAYSVAEWSMFLDAAGLTLEHSEDYRWEPYEFAEWAARQRMPVAEQAALEQWLLAAPERFRSFFEITEQDGRVVSLRGTFGILVGRKPGVAR
ncbi:MAG: class I SAM-dependent methyltransferase [Chloroflexaceae bacterium]|nr:class I SAM-dependent methyltransferase [Chloroflexaceae bacterium]